MTPSPEKQQRSSNASSQASSSRHRHQEEEDDDSRKATKRGVLQGLRKIARLKRSSGHPQKNYSVEWGDKDHPQTGTGLVSEEDEGARRGIPAAEEQQQKDGEYSKDSDPFDLVSRFVDNQEIYFLSALAEIRQGKKRGCWLWFMLPTPPYVVNGVERGSSMNRHFCLRGDESVKAYLAMEPLRSNYFQLVSAIWMQLRYGNTLSNIFGPMDDVKVVSSLTLFGRIATEIGDLELAETCLSILKEENIISNLKLFYISYQ